MTAAAHDRIMRIVSDETMADRSEEVRLILRTGNRCMRERKRTTRFLESCALLCLGFALVGCAMPNRRSEKDIRREMEAIWQQEHSVAGFEQRLEALGAKIEVTANPAATTALPPRVTERVATMLDAKTGKLIRVVYTVTRARVLITRVELSPPLVIQTSRSNSAPARP